MPDMVRNGSFVGVAVFLAVLIIYLFTMAPGLTWANHGADGGELIAAAVQNGVPHPPGYPLYILLLQGWLWLGQLLAPMAERAWLGNLLSGVCAASSAGLTALIVAQLIWRIEHDADYAPTKHSLTGRAWLAVWGWAALVGLIWACSPLFWGQALITEVYALHLLLTVLLAWSLLRESFNPTLVAFIVALGVAHHLTFVLILPAALYWQIFGPPQADNQRSVVEQSWRAVMILGGGVLLGLLFYLRVPFVAGSGPPPINWGYPDSFEGFMWLVSADAYRPYLFGLPSESIFQRVSAWAYLTTAQYTPVGLAFALLGLTFLDQRWKQLRTFTLLWGIPISVYAIGYHTRDSEIYLLPFFWIVAIWLGIGVWLASSFLMEWLANRHVHLGWFWPHFVVLLLVVIWIGFNWPSTSLRDDHEAAQFLHEARTIIEPNSLVYSSADAETFALWYGAWGLDEPWQDESLDEQPVLVNSALLQFEWYQRLLSDRYGHIAGIDQLSLQNPLSSALTDNIDNRPIYFSEEPSYIPSKNLETVGRFWRYTVEKQ